MCVGRFLYFSAPVGGQARRDRIMAELTLQTSVQFVRGVGPARVALLHQLGLQTVHDLLYFLPRDILDLTQVSDPRDLIDGKLATIRGKVVDRDARQLKAGKTLTAIVIDCGGGFVRGLWFNQPWMLQKFPDNTEVLLSAKPKRHAGRWEMSHPRVQWLNAGDLDAHGGILPIYSLTEGLQMADMRRIMRGVVEDCVDLVVDEFPEPFRHRLKLFRKNEALRNVHLPTSKEHYFSGRRRLIFQDLLELQLGLALRRRRWRSRGAAARLPVNAKIDSRIRRLLPFEYTAGQSQAIQEIVADLNQPFAMHRLLQADVGAGKTAIAVYAMLVAVAAGFQTVLMAPTEVLAQQHWRTIDRLLANSRVQRVLLTGQLTAAARRDAVARIQSGEIQLVIGTQAVIQKDIKFARLGLVVIDEQHKFGVMQRAHFASGETTPHTLVMTATPIPRSLCLTQFGDLDLTVMTDTPPGRKRVVTSRVFPGEAREKVWKFIRQKLDAGRQLYVICPRVGSSEAIDADENNQAAEHVFRRLRESELAGYRLGLAHGQLKPELKSAAMEDFRTGRTQALVATTVVEVGVDVPNATLMIVLGAEGFGLSQLHQLRGRVGRGSFQGYCFLFSDSEDQASNERLQTLEQNPGGFEVAEADFRLRGPGDILGTRQHGDLPLAVADLARDAELLTEARQTAFQLVQSGEFDQPDFAPLKIQVLERFGKLFDLAGSG
jgi:ATP-dependent DNA helicase RecG